jgi:hypothetical protein
VDLEGQAPKMKSKAKQTNWNCLVNLMAAFGISSWYIGEAMSKLAGILSSRTLSGFYRDSAPVNSYAPQDRPSNHACPYKCSNFDTLY